MDSRLNVIQVVMSQMWVVVMAARIPQMNLQLLIPEFLEGR
jgi:hypothetical protein